jgi:formylglycine-generating enzyme required for sulfatase activity
MKRALIILCIVVLFAISCSSGDSDAEPLPFIDTGADSDSWAAVPSGEFLKGQHEHETELGYNFEIMVTDVTNEQFADYLNDALADGSIKREGDEILGYYPGDDFDAFRHEEKIVAGDYLHLSVDQDGLRLVTDGQEFVAQAGYENHPMTQITWFGAKAYCDYYDQRLPTENEWEKAARGNDNRPYPWGSGVERNNANYYSSHDLFEKIAGDLGDTTPVGFYNGETYEGYETLDSPSPYGLYDMAGNVWQWTGDVYEDQHYRYLRGGSKDNYAHNLRIWTRNSAGPEHFGPSIGFRCARDG